MDFELLFHLGMLAFSGVVYGIARLVHRRHQRQQTWLEAAASSAGMRVVEFSSSSGVRAQAGPLQAVIKDAGLKQSLTRIVIGIVGPPGFLILRIRSQSGSPWVHEIELGDAAFDRSFILEGSTRMVCALLDAETRRLLLRVNSMSQVEIADGELRVETPDRHVAEVLPLLLEVSRRFDRSTDEPGRLAANAKEDPEADVRLANLLVLARELPDDPVTREALRTACSDPSPHLRLRAAQELGTEAWDVLLVLAESLTNDVLCAQAVSTLRQVLAPELARNILDQALKKGRLKTACACLQALGLRGAGAVETLARVLAQERGEIAIAAVRALALTESSTAEPSLIEALQSAESDLRLEAATALGEIGSAAAVVALKQAAESSLWNRELRGVARQAIATIQSRVKGASPGQLSLAESEAGQLSLATDPGGQLSLPGDEAGRLSLSDSPPS